MINTTLFIVIALVVAIWILIELKRFKHKLFAIFLIVLILGTYTSFTVVLRGQNIDLTTVEGLKEGGQLYFVWLGSVFGNLKTITTNAINMEWSATNNVSKLDKENSEDLWARFKY